MIQKRLERGDTALLVVDVQERLCRAMLQARLERLINRTVALLEAARVLGLPVAFTEQYPNGLGHTIEPIRSKLGQAARFEKVRFSSVSADLLAALGQRRTVLVAGMEAHVCVYQTARDLVERGFTPYLCRDAIISRTDEDREAGLALARDAGAVITTAECALFDLLGEAGTPEFRAISAAVK
ncbi:MAG TPA: isochorismatase family protein [Myxococcaceae bacterium]|nr:isochorismatase family protein [Myxococcaceae bacterium]